MTPERKAELRKLCPIQDRNTRGGELAECLDAIDDLALRRCNCAPCDVGACNCGSWHRRPSKADLAEIGA